MRLNIDERFQIVNRLVEYLVRLTFLQRGRNLTRQPHNYLGEKLWPAVAGEASPRSQGLIIVTNKIRELSRMPGTRVGNWV